VNSTQAHFNKAFIESYDVMITSKEWTYVSQGFMIRNFKEG
jgi:hypothetical protein